MTARPNWLKPPGAVVPGLRIGLLGGSFNPAHAGHLYITEVAMKQLCLDFVWWLVSPQNPLKTPTAMAPLQQRIASAREIAGRHPRIRVSDIETRMGTRYTIDTVTGLKKRFGQVHFVWLMGSDNLLAFHRWRNCHRLAESIPIVVVRRPGTVLAPLKSKAARRFAKRGNRAFATTQPPALVVLDGRRSCTSATAIRRRGLGWFNHPVLH